MAMATVLTVKTCVNGDRQSRSPLTQGWRYGALAQPVINLEPQPKVFTKSVAAIATVTDKK